MLSDSATIKNNIDWAKTEKELSYYNMTQCKSQLLDILTNIVPNENFVKIFHIYNNDKPKKSTEPTFKNTTKMIYKFLAYVYQRNIVASLVKYIILKPLLDKFETSQLMPKKHGLFYNIYKRLQEIIFECALTSFNGSNYDNFLLCNGLIIIQTKLRQKFKMFKKGSSISTVYLLNKVNFNKFSSVKAKTKAKNWTMRLYIKDIRNLVSANMSLDKIAKLFNLPVSKLCFPYEQATSVKRLKTLKSLQPYDDLFWKDTFFSKTVLLEQRLEAQQLYTNFNFTNLYEFGTYYLKQDCLVLHSIVLTLFNTYLQDSINLFIRRNYSQSSLAYQQFFIIEPSKQIEILLAPKTINNSFYNYLIKQAVTGGLCTSFVHNTIDENTIINEHFNYLEKPMLNSYSWPNFSNLINWNKSFTETPAGITTIDIRSLYPSASLKPLPVNVPLFYSRFTFEDYNKLFETVKHYKNLNLNMYCNNVQQKDNPKLDMFKLISQPPRFYNEFNALSHYLQQLPKNITILRFQSHFTALGQATFVNFPVDGFLCYKNNSDNITYVKIIQYQSVYHHGHINTCFLKNSNSELEEKTKKVRDSIKEHILCFTKNFEQHLVNVNFEYVEISDCEFFNHKIPKIKKFMLNYKQDYTYNSFLESVYNNKLSGLLVVKNLQIKKNNQNPIFGFIIQKIEYGLKHMSPYTQEQISKLSLSKRVVSVHKNKSFMVISTEYFNWLKFNFGFENEPQIYHALLFQLENYLTKSIQTKLLIRKELKLSIKNETDIYVKQNLEIKAELIKLMLNSCYGYTLCNLTSSKFKQFENRKKLPKVGSIISCVQIDKNIYLVEKSRNFKEPFQTLLGHVGCYILFNSKIILLKRLYFLLKYLNPRHAQLLYMDTDSAHFLVKHKLLKDNVDSNLRFIFDHFYDKHFETGNKTSGIWVEEGFYTVGEYLGEKCYRLYNKDNSLYITHMKGLNANFQKEYHQKNIDPKKLPFLNYNHFFKSPDFIIFKTHMSKNLFSNYVPIKRYFVCSTGSLPLKF